jgi:pyridinium-3,5-biscarboxylic acid mononucleotide sulfurtransferase
MIEKKENRLNSILNELGSFAVAFSGGVDSSFLLYRAHVLRKADVVAVTIRTPYIPVNEIADSIEFTSKHGIKHSILNLDFPEVIRQNPVNRCYLCKKNLFTHLKDFAKMNNLRYVVDGSNADDTADFRPGMKALQELGIMSPLLEAGLTKEEIRQLSEKEGLDTWNKPAMACLLTRIPYDTDVLEKDLRMIEGAENMLFECGFPGTRVRLHGDLARIECLPGFIDKMLQKSVREQIITGLKKLGFRYVSLDLEGYRTGSYNPQKENTV